MKLREFTLTHTLSIGLLICVLSTANATTAFYPFHSPDKAKQFDRITHQLRCLVCANQTIADSNASLAEDLRQRVYQSVLAGEREDEIIQSLVDRYGQYVVYQPQWSPMTWVLWGFPIAVIGLAGIGFIRSTRRSC